jgi:protein-tyrosine-phosphatase
MFFMTEQEEKYLLILCGGGVGRSVMLKGFLTSLGARKETFVTAGVYDLSDKYPNGPHENVVKVMDEKRISVRDSIVQQVTPEMASRAAAIFALCDPTTLPSCVQEHPVVFVHEIPDPPENDIDAIRDTRDTIELYAMGIIVWNRLVGTGDKSTSDDIFLFKRYALNSAGSFAPLQTANSNLFIRNT